MDQKLSNWASIAEIASGIAVVATLVILIVGIRENTDVTRAAMYAGIIDSVVENRTLRIEHPELNRIVLKYLSEGPKNLEVVEWQILYPYLQNVFQLYEKAYYSREYGVIGEAEWARYEGTVCTHYGLITSAGLLDRFQSIVTQEFWDDAALTCSE